MAAPISSRLLTPQSSTATIQPYRAFGVSSCPLNKAEYVQTGDLSTLPLLCHYPVKISF
ncbi:hypothetical protein Tsubulata_028036, partial [Turnera subulata]